MLIGLPAPELDWLDQLSPSLSVSPATGQEASRPYRRMPPSWPRLLGLWHKRQRPSTRAVRGHTIGLQEGVRLERHQKSKTGPGIEEEIHTSRPDPISEVERTINMRVADARHLSRHGCELRRQWSNHRGDEEVWRLVTL